MAESLNGRILDQNRNMIASLKYARRRGQRQKQRQRQFENRNRMMEHKQHDGHRNADEDRGEVFDRDRDQK